MASTDRVTINSIRVKPVSRDRGRRIADPSCSPQGNLGGRIVANKPRADGRPQGTDERPPGARWRFRGDAKIGATAKGRPAMRQRAISKGFTLIELMVVLAIIAIIAAIAVPSYTESVRKGRRADAVREIGRLQLELERWRAENPCYGQSAVGTCPTFTAVGAYPALPDATASPYYTLTIVTASTGPSGYQITAAPRAGSAQVGDRCGTYTFTLAAGVLTKTAGSSNCGI
ncbi:type IV pilin protein [Cognatiluteimonas weifangensis]|nr:type IV pilin protein [Luteimonas weifangensis]